jgi:small subunit ribosomal protein S17
MAKKELIGEVISDRMVKTVVVRIMHKAKHPAYGRVVKRYNTFKVHDEKKSAHTGDIVKICHCRPLSKTKNFRLVEVVKQAPAVVNLKDEPT